MRLAIVAFVSLLLAWGARAALAQTDSTYRLIDLTSDYVTFYDDTERMRSSDRVAAFKTQVAPLFPQFYRSGRPGAAPTQAEFERRVLNSLDAFPAVRAGYAQAASDFRIMLDPAITSFRATFPDLGSIGDIYLIHSLGEMDGGTRPVAGHTYFVFGVDMIARFHPHGAEQPFFHHELFHIYNQRAFSGCSQIWCWLWAEGLAVLAAEELNPGSTDDQLLLNIPEPIRPTVDAHLQEAVCVVRSRMNGQAGRDELFSFGRINSDLPPRFGYYVGYLVAKHARRTHSLQQLAHMGAASARREVDAGLASLASCS